MIRASGSRPSGSPQLVGAILALCARVPRQEGALVIGINGPQGCGKSTLAAAVVARVRAAGKVAVALSIDDFYLTRAAQTELASCHPGNRYLEHRGYPGTHDVELGSATLQALRRARAGDVVRCPVYDKSAHDGRGDRAARSLWPEVAGPIDLIVFEGWMLGFPPVALAANADRFLADSAELLPAYQPWLASLDAFVHLEASDLRDIVAWRVDAERSRRETGAAALTDEQARDYIERFVPAYSLWVPALLAHPPARQGAPVPALWCRLGRDREPVEIAERPPVSPSAP